MSTNTEQLTDTASRGHGHHRPRGRTVLAAAGGALAVGAAIAALTIPAGASDSSSNSPSGTAAAASSTHDCDGHWPLVDNGRPDSFSANADGGAYIWHDTDGWHLRVTHQGTNKRTFAGLVRADAALVDHRVADEAHDTLRRQARSFTFVFHNYGAVDGVDFKTNCASNLTFDLWVDGHRLGTQRVSLGDGSAHPATNPFTVTRVGATAPGA